MKCHFVIIFCHFHVDELSFCSCHFVNITFWERDTWVNLSFWQQAIIFREELKSEKTWLVREYTFAEVFLVWLRQDERVFINMMAIF